VQLTRDITAAHYIRAWEAGRVRIAERWVDGNVIIGAERVIENWQVTAPSGLAIEDLAPAIELQPEIILLGTGTRRLLPDVDLMAALGEHAIGLEIMNTPAACRTFNVLLQERRRVVAALFNQ
jgi:uncharacterized protein